jgi:hypothetical protein
MTTTKSLIECWLSTVWITSTHKHWLLGRYYHIGRAPAWKDKPRPGNWLFLFRFSRKRRLLKRQLLVPSIPSITRDDDVLPCSLFIALDAHKTSTLFPWRPVSLPQLPRQDLLVMKLSSTRRLSVRHSIAACMTSMPKIPAWKDMKSSLYLNAWTVMHDGIMCNKLFACVVLASVVFVPNKYIVLCYTL